MRGRTGTDISDGLVVRAVGAFVASVDLPALDTAAATTLAEREGTAR